MTSHLSQKLVQLEDLIPETDLVAIICQDVEALQKHSHLEFHDSYDDLDFLVFTTLNLPDDARVALVHHQHSPTPGVEICVRYDQADVPLVLKNVMAALKLELDDLSWVHPKYAEEFKS